MRLLLAAALLLILGAGGATSRKPARCHGLYGIAYVCDANAATPKARGEAFAERLLARWNGVAGNHGFPADRAACVPDGEAVYTCEWRIVDQRNHRYLCRQAVISTAWLEFSGTWVACVGAFKPPVKNTA